MKTLIENSIEIYGMGHPDVKHVFNIENDEEREDRLFRSLEKIKNRKLTIRFKYSENDVLVNDKLQLIIIDGVEIEIRKFIISSINEYLNPVGGKGRKKK